MVISMILSNILKERSNKYKNMEYFPLILKHRVTMMHFDLPDNMELILSIFRKLYANEYIVEPHVFCNGDWYDDLCLKEYSYNPKLRYLSNWIMRKLILEKHLTWETAQVRMRIASNMLFQVGVITGGKNLLDILQSNFVNNVWAVHRQKLIYDLPFYQGQSRRNPLQLTMDKRITESEIQLIKQAQKGNELAFNKLFSRYKEFVDNVLFSYVNDMDEARDLTNIVFLKVHQKLSTFVDYSSFGGWLRIIANRTAIDYLRRMKEKAVELGEDTGRLPEELTNTSEEEDLVNLLEYEALLKEFKKLPEKTQRIFNLFYVEDLPIDEISKVLKTPTGTIKAALSRTRRKLKNNLNV